MTIHMSACGVICAECPAFLAGQTKDPAGKERVAAAWHTLYELNFGPEVISCGGCLGPDEDLFFTFYLSPMLGTPLLSLARSDQLCQVR